jgi:2-alkyl-3-oxoalkanoate reductase
MNVLVTGGGGFLGRVIVRRLLDRGYNVFATGRTTQPELLKQGVKFTAGNLADADFINELCKGMDVVFHVAAKAGIWGDWDSYKEPNIIGTNNVINACRKHGVKSLIYTSTPSVVFNRKPFNGADESLPYGSRWLCHYAHSKAIAEEAILDAHDEQGLQTVALRPHLIWGPGDPHIVPRIIESARLGRLTIVGDASNKVDITHVENAADAHINAMDALEQGRAGGKFYFISQGEPVILWEWINDLLAQLGEPVVKKKVSYRSAYLIGATMEFFYKALHLKGEPRMTRFLAMELSKDHYFNITAAKRDLGYHPKISTEEGVRDLVNWYKAGNR